MVYDPVEYWSNREHPNTAENPGISKAESDFIGPRIQSVNSLLELGPGVGRLFPLYSKINFVTTLDISSNYQERASLGAAQAGIEVKAHYLESVTDEFPFESLTFDVGLAAHVLMHIPFENIEHTMKQLARCCERVIVISAKHRYWPKKNQEYDRKWHCFAHDYRSVCSQLGLMYFDEVTLAERELDGAFAFQFSGGFSNAC